MSIFVVEFQTTRGMGNYINIGNAGFQSARNGEYVDKSALISIVNATINTERRFSCVSRCRRFGKSLAAKMLNAYYDHSCDSRQLFADLQIANDPSFEKHLNKYPVIYLDMTAFNTRLDDSHLVKHISNELKKDVIMSYPDVAVDERDDFMQLLVNINNRTGQQFIFIIDEWDAICREFLPGTTVMDEYANWLSRMFKVVNANNVFAAVYMTGILPIKKYKAQSALNNFTEYSMVQPGRMGGCFGFTREEVKALANKFGVDFDELEKWYDGYMIGDQASIFNPNSVMQAAYSGYCESYWGSTGSFEAVTNYIQMNFDGLKDDAIKMLAGGRVKTNPTKFQNDLSIIESRDDVLTALVHLGYLSYDRRHHECYIPNREVSGEMANAIEASRWKPVADALQKSERLLQGYEKMSFVLGPLGDSYQHSDESNAIATDSTGAQCQVKQGTLLNVVGQKKGWYEVSIPETEGTAYIKQSLCIDPNAKPSGGKQQSKKVNNQDNADGLPAAEEADTPAEEPASTPTNTSSSSSSDEDFEEEVEEKTFIPYTR